MEQYNNIISSAAVFRESHPVCSILKISGMGVQIYLHRAIFRDTTIDVTRNLSAVASCDGRKLLKQITDNSKVFFRYCIQFLGTKKIRYLILKAASLFCMSGCNRLDENKHFKGRFSLVSKLKRDVPFRLTFFI